MAIIPDSIAQYRERVNSYFRENSSYWEEIYTSPSLKAEIIRDRHTAVLTWIDDLALPRTARVLEIGCGAGFMAVALAQRGFQVDAIDSVVAMVELARRHAAQNGLAGRLFVNQGDAYSLAFQNASFDLVVAIGLLPWLGQSQSVLQGIARVLKPGGYVILTTANRTGLASMLDPLISPALAPAKRRMKNALERIGVHHRAPSMQFHSSRLLDATLAETRLTKSKGMTRGFGFSFFRHSILPLRLGVALQRTLQSFADRGLPGLRSAGMAYFVLARKSPFHERCTDSQNPHYSSS